MASATLGLDLNVSLVGFREFERAILTSVAGILNQAVAKSLQSIRNGIANLVVQAVQASPEYDSILGGELWHRLGIVNPSGVLSGILQTLANGVTVHNHGIRVAGSHVEGGMDIDVVKSLEQLLSVPGASFTSENNYEVPWLQWLLTGGDSVILSDHYYIGGAEDYSRTGYGIMVKSHKGWHIPAEFAGTASDNWITRALAHLEEPVAQLIARELTRSL